MQNSGRMPSFIATRRCLIYVKLPTIKCLCVCTHSPGAAHCARAEPCAGAQSAQWLRSLHHSCSVLLQGSHQHSMVRVTDGNIECLSAFKHSGIRMWSITAPWHRTSLKTTAFTLQPASPLWEVLQRPKGKWAGGRNGKKILWANTFPSSCSGEPCCSEEQVQWGCTQPIVCEPLKMYCPLSMASRSSQSSSQSNQLEQSLYVMDFMSQDTNENQRKKSSPAWENKKVSDIFAMFQWHTLSRCV